MIVLANGCFDPLHAGHIAHLREARSMGSQLVVALTTDAAVRRERGEGRPFTSWADRADQLRELRCVTFVVPSETCIDAIRFVRPDIFVKGIDYTAGINLAVANACKELGITVAFTATRKQSSSELIRRIDQWARA